ncbi:alpha/beta hydrolase [Aspergillus affinis]|uniref:alpha/beta hydrolase n=1 Tax=Aspergillus affinis TaxID=1070780 RepID=UPI0022FDBE3D|nr:alpha/beta-hydrolase [Aspergillus affinis]KAI9037725.1 alpha/beta-hydrolase [Aspergillus affinis]
MAREIFLTAWWQWHVKLQVKLFFVFDFLLVNIFRLLFYLAYYALPSARPPRWPYRRCISIELVKLSVEFIYGIEHNTKLSLNPGREGDRFVIIKPRLDGLYTDILDDSKIKPALIGAVWYPRPYSTTETSKNVVLHFHGGAYLTGDAREETCGFSARSLSRDFDDAPVLCVDYRLANTPSGRFPAAIQDAVTAYRYLNEDLGIDSSRIILSGDSAGGNLVLALLRYLVDHPNLLSLPRAALLWSAWINFSDMKHINRSVNEEIDCLKAKFLQWAVNKLTDNGRSVPSTHPYLCFANSPFHVSVPIWAMVGTAESFYESNVQFVQDMRAIGNTVTLYEIPDAPHDAFIARRAYELQAEVEEATRNAWEFIQSNLAVS